MSGNNQSFGKPFEISPPQESSKDPQHKSEDLEPHEPDVTSSSSGFKLINPFIQPVPAVPSNIFGGNAYGGEQPSEVLGQDTGGLPETSQIRFESTQTTQPAPLFGQKGFTQGSIGSKQLWVSDTSMKMEEKFGAFDAGKVTKVGRISEECKGLETPKTGKVTSSSQRRPRKIRSVLEQAIGDLMKGKETEKLTHTHHEKFIMTLNSLYICNIPNENFDKSIIKQHFSQFGDVTKLFLCPKRNACTVGFLSHDVAEKAKNEGSMLRGQKLKIFWSKHTTRKEKEKEISSPVSGSDSEEQSKNYKSLIEGPEESSQRLASLVEELQSTKKGEQTQEQPVDAKNEPSQKDSVISQLRTAVQKERKRSPVKPVIPSEVADELVAMAEGGSYSFLERPETEDIQKSMRKTKVGREQVVTKMATNKLKKTSGRRASTDSVPFTVPSRTPMKHVQQAVTASDFTSSDSAASVKQKVMARDSCTEVVSLASFLSTSKKAVRQSASSVDVLPIGSTTSCVRKPGKQASSSTDLVPFSSVYSTTVSADVLKLLVKRPAFTAEDRYCVLEARDKLMRMYRIRSTELPSVCSVGTCPDMCPEKERYHREARQQVSMYETASGKPKDAQITAVRAVKQYSRSSADQEEPLPHELRPLPILTITMNYLLWEIVGLCEKESQHLGEWYHFVWDRTRSIRKDITQQELCDTGTVTLVEQCARFHIFCSAHLFGEDTTVFDEKINTENLTKCLQSLKYMYHDLAKKGEQCPNEPEFRAYIILLNLNSVNFMCDLRELNPKVQHSEPVCFALSVYDALASNNYWRFFKLVRGTTFLNACILLRYFYQIRSRGLFAMSKAFGARGKPASFPFTELMKSLGFDNVEEAKAFCSHFQLKFTEDGQSVVFSREITATEDSTLPVVKPLSMIHSKKTGAVGEIVAGGSLPAPLYRYYTPHDSFTAEGFLKEAALTAKDQCELHGDVVKSKPELSLVQGTTVQLQEEKVAEVKEIKVHPEVETTTPLIHSVLAEPSKQPFVFQVPSFRFPTSEKSESQNHVPGQPAYISASSFSFVPKPGFEVRLEGNNSEVQIPLKVKDEVTVNEATITEQRQALGDISDEELKEKEEDEVDMEDEDYVEEDEEMESVHSMEEPKLIKLRDKMKRELAQTMIDEEEERRKERKAIEAEEKRKLQESIKNMKAMEDQRLMNIAIVTEEIIDDVVSEECSAIATHVLLKARLELFLEKRSKRLARRCYFKWKDFVTRRQKLEKSFHDFPAWISQFSLQQQAKQCPRSLEISSPDSSFTPYTVPDQLYGESLIDVGSAISESLSSKMKRLNCYKRSVFYKLVISLPNDIEAPCFVDLLTKSIEQMFYMKSNLTSTTDHKPLMLHKYTTSEFESLFVSVRRVQGPELVEGTGENPDACKGLDGLILRVHLEVPSRIHSAAVRLRNILNAKTRTPAVPLAVVLTGNTDAEPTEVASELKLNMFKAAGRITTYRIFLTTRKVKKYIPDMVAVLKWLAQEASASPAVAICPLLEAMTELVNDTGYRVRSILHDPAFALLSLEGPNMFVNCYNKTLDKILSMLTDRTIWHLNTGAPEFMPVITQVNTSVHSLQYQVVPDYCQTEEYVSFLKQAVESLKLAQFKPWPVTSLSELDNLFHSYCEDNRIRDKTKLYRIINESYERYSALGCPEEQWTSFLYSICWFTVVEALTTEKLRSLHVFDPFNEMHIQRCIIVIRREQLDAFYNTVWYLPEDINSKGEKQEEVRNLQFSESINECSAVASKSARQSPLKRHHKYKTFTDTLDSFDAVLQRIRTKQMEAKRLLVMDLEDTM